MYIECECCLASKQRITLPNTYLISTRRTGKPCGFTMQISSREYRFLNNIVKRNTKIDCMGLFEKVTLSLGLECCWFLRQSAKTMSTPACNLIRSCFLKFNHLDDVS